MEDEATLLNIPSKVLNDVFVKKICPRYGLNCHERALLKAAIILMHLSGDLRNQTKKGTDDTKKKPPRLLWSQDSATIVARATRLIV